MKGTLFHLLVFFTLTIPAISQTRVEVITKTVKDQLDYLAGHTIEVEGKSATISILRWDKNEIGVEMKLISKGLSKEIAEKELEYQRYVINKIDETFVIRNYLLLPKGLDKLTTIQETEIKIHLPSEVKLSVISLFGNTSIKDVTGSITLESKYGELQLDNVNGKVEVKSTFGDLFVNDFNGTLSAELEHTASFIDGFTGSAFVKSNLGDITWSNVGDLTKFKVIAEKSDVSLKFIQLDLDEYHWQLKSKYGEIEVARKYTEGKKISFGEEENPTIDISTDFGNITIKE